MLPLTLTRRFPKGNAFIWSDLAFNTAFGPATLACQLTPRTEREWFLYGLAK